MVESTTARRIPDLHLVRRDGRDPSDRAIAERCAAEAGLVQRARDDREAFAELYRGHYAAIGSYLLRRTGDAHATEDLLGDVFLAALRAMPRFELRGVPFRSWLLRIATHAANKWARAERRRPRRLPEFDDVADGAPQHAEQHAATDERAWVQRCLLEIPPRFQAALALHYVEGLSIDEVAATLGCRPGTVKSRLSRGRAALEGVMTRSIVGRARARTEASRDARRDGR
jgi:RNA polymerase sigma-70 factor (ECF subfamily)